MRSIILVITALLLIVIFSKGIMIGQIITALVVSVALVMAGVSLIIGNKIRTGIGVKTVEYD